MKTHVGCSLAGLLICAACSSEPPAANSSGSGGSGGSAAPSGGGGSQASPSGAGGTIQAGASGNAGASSGAGTGGAPPVAGASGASGNAGASGSAGGGVTPGCANHDYDLCIDFENGIDETEWSGGSESAIVTNDVAHGAHAYRLYPNSGALLKATSLGNITTQMWGRFYVHFKPGAPGGHGNIVGAFDQSNNWYEMGWQFDAMMGVWHRADGNERPLRSKPFIVDQWYCVELFFDGTKTEMPKWWIDGKEAEYYMAANETLTPAVVTKFERVEVGFTPYAGLGLQMPDGKGPKDDRVLTDMAIDDIAFDTERIGCITP
jgi:hypothetical protein